MIKIKTYRSIKFKELHHIIIVDDNKMYIDFIGGASYPIQTNGIFSTADPKVQKALEKGSGYNKLYQLISVDGESTLEDKVVLSDQELIIKLQQEKSELNKQLESLKRELTEKDALIETLTVTKKGIKVEPGNEDGTVIKVEGVENAQQARDYLADNYEYKKQSLGNPKAVLNAAKKLNIEFPDWNFEK